VLATKREGYSYFDFSPTDFLEAISFKGMRKLMMKYTRFGIGEVYRGIFFGAQIKLLQRYIPEIKRSDVTRGRSGVRAQALDEDGTLVDDFVFDDGIGVLAPKLLHVRNAPSPGATSSLAIAKMVVEKATEKFQI
jgi:2-hydroxyglutarate dehydrogenase